MGRIQPNGGIGKILSGPKLAALKAGEIFLASQAGSRLEKDEELAPQFADSTEQSIAHTWKNWTL